MMYKNGDKAKNDNRTLRFIKTGVWSSKDANLAFKDKAIKRKENLKKK